MLKRSLSKSSWCKLRTQYARRNSQYAANNTDKCELAKIRNIGILAHIDAGKTTTTERMLFYSGLIKHMGEVHHGNTVTDYMEQERERGITITSACVTFDWKNYRFNLIDTPGHIDFTMGVEQTLRVLDGAIVILDGSAGVEAQTLTVCRQADRYHVPKIIYVNKMDRPDANFDACLNSIETKLDVRALPTQFPLKEDGVLKGMVDVVSLRKLTYDNKDQGSKLVKTDLSESSDPRLWELTSEMRRSLTDKLSSLDDTLANEIIEQESLERISAQALFDSLQRVTVARTGVPVLLGSSYKNVGVQPLMDGIVLYLPSPESSRDARRYRCFGDNFSARVFKIVHDKQRGPITFFRVYTGSLKKGDKLYDVQKGQPEQSGRLYVACADDYEEISTIDRGNVAAVTGLKYATVGDLLTSSGTAASRAKQAMLNSRADPDEVEAFFDGRANVPEPVFFCTIEPPSLSSATALEVALQQLEREDPSLRVNYSSETDEIVLGGMGELHIEIIRDRIRSEYKIDADLGPLQIAYRETIRSPIKDTCVSEHSVGKTKHYVKVTISLIPNYKGPQTLLLDRSQETAENIGRINPRLLKAVEKGVASALVHGPKLSCPVMDVGVKLHWLEVGKGTSDTMVSGAVSQCIRKLCTDADIVLMEPIMRLEVVTPEEYSSAVLADLCRRRTNLKQISVRGGNKVLETLTPLAELFGYSTALRTVSSGNATFTSEFDHYEEMDSTVESEAIQRVTGVTL